MSSLLFLAVMEVIFRRLKARWSKLNTRRVGSYYGIVIDDPLDPLTNLRFADDVLLTATSRTDLRKMIADLEREALTFGLKMHAGKTKILTTDSAHRQNPASCGGHDVEVLQENGSEKYLGRKFSVDDFHITEFNHRISMGWAAFFKFKNALCNRYVAIKDRMALFVSCVSPCVLYACGTWTLTVEMELKLRSTQRRMLRWMVRSARRGEEEWPEYIQRATHTAEHVASTHGCVDWVSLQRKRKHVLAAKCALSDDSRWSKRLLEWTPWFRCAPYRDVGHPQKRWTEF